MLRTRSIPILVAVLACLTTPTGRAQPKKTPKLVGDAMIYKYLSAETDKLSKKEFDGATSLKEWKQRQPRLHRELLYMLGLDPMPKKTPLRVTFTGTMEHEGVIVDNLHFQSMPGLYVTANLYRPKGTKQKPKSGAKYKRYPAVVYVCGHSGRGRNGCKTAFQDHGIWFARNGYICIILDTLQLGEIPGVHHGTYGVPWRHLRSRGVKDKKKINEGPRWWWHSAGYSPAGVECWNGIRAIDYLASRPDVNGKRIAVTGISGGGATTFWIAAADKRVACAVPVSGMSDLESYIKNKVINGHCDCMFVYNTFQWEWTTIAALIAPRPMMFANSDNDRIFPMDGNRRIAKRLRKLYKWYDKSENFKEYVSKGGHAYRPDLRIAIFKFINKHIKGDNGPVEDTAKYATIAGERLRAFPTDADFPKDVINHRIDEMFVKKAKVGLPEKGKFGEWKKRLVRELRSEVFISLPNRKNRLKKQPYYFVGDNNPVVVMGDNYVSDPPEWLKRLFPKRPFAYHFGIGVTKKSRWSKKNPPNYPERSFCLLGRTVAQQRAVGLIATLLDLQSMKKKEQQFTLIGRGQAGILAAYAALFEPSIKEVVIINPPTSHMQGPHFLNVLRVIDIPEALGLLAPRVKLTLINAKDKAFDRTAEIYRRAGAAKMFVRK